MSDTTESQNEFCPKCEQPLPLGAPKSLCPTCLMASAMQPTQTFTAEALATPPEIGVVQAAFPQFEILELIGTGGMGVVYKAKQISLDREVALKLLAPHRENEPGFAERFTREAKALAALNHPNIITIHDFGAADGFYYLLMEFVDGVNLRQVMQKGRFTPEQALVVVPSICEALQYAHDQGIVHRDIKPENLLLDQSGRVKVADFGIARILNRDETETSSPASDIVSADLTMDTALGTPNYMAPEQADAPKEVDHRADIYSLGVVFYEMLTGERPGEKLQAPSSRATIDVRLDEIVLRALADAPDLRWQQAEDFRTEIQTVATTPEPAVEQSITSSSQKMPTAIALWLTGILLAAISMLYSPALLDYHREKWDAQLETLRAKKQSQRNQVEKWEDTKLKLVEEWKLSYDEYEIPRIADEINAANIECELIDNRTRELDWKINTLQKRKNHPRLVSRRQIGSIAIGLISFGLLIAATVRLQGRRHRYVAKSIVLLVGLAIVVMALSGRPDNKKTKPMPAAKPAPVKLPDRLSDVTDSLPQLMSDESVDQQFPAPTADEPPLKNTHLMVETFLRAPNWKARLPMVYRAKQVAPQMEKYYQNNPDFSLSRFKIKLFQMEREKKWGGPFWVYQISQTTAGHDQKGGYPLIIRVENSNLKVDWEVFSEFSDRQFVKYREGQLPSKNEFRVVAGRVPSYDGPDSIAFKDLDQYLCYEINPPYGGYREFSEYSFVKKGTKIANTMESMIALGDEPLAVTIKIGRKNFSHGIRHYVIEELVNEGWFKAPKN